MPTLEDVARIDERDLTGEETSAEATSSPHERPPPRDREPASRPGDEGSIFGLWRSALEEEAGERARVRTGARTKDQWYCPPAGGRGSDQRRREVGNFDVQVG